MPFTQVAFWNVEGDVLEPDTNGRSRDFRTIIAASGYAPPPGSIVICSLVVIAPTGLISVLGRVQRSQAVSTSRVRVRVEPFHLLQDPIPLKEMQPHVDAHGDRHLREAFRDANHSVPVMPKTFTLRSAKMILTSLHRVSKEASSILNDLLLQTPDLPALEESRLQEERDAVTTAIRIADLSESSYPPLTPTRTLEPGLAFGLCFDARHFDSEDDLLAADLRRFDDTGRLTEIAGSMVVVQDRNVRLTVINVNRKRLERVYGVDLVYYDHINDSAVAVQYKRMEKIKHPKSDGSLWSEWVYRDKAQLLKHLDRMKPHVSPKAIGADDWRLSSSPNFVKFVKAEDFNPNSKTLLKGMYVPDEYLKLGIQEGRFHTGPRGGFQIGYQNTRYFTAGTFIELVRRCWIGTRETDKSSLASEVAAMANNHEVVLALRNKNRPSP